MRFEDTPGLFGLEVGNGTLNETQCGWCGTVYEDKEEGSDDFVRIARFGDVIIAECCFEAVEAAVLSKMRDILPWYGRFLDKRKSELQKNLDALSDVNRKLEEQK